MPIWAIPQVWEDITKLCMTARQNIKPDVTLFFYFLYMCLPWVLIRFFSLCLRLIWNLLQFFLSPFSVLEWIIYLVLSCSVLIFIKIYNISKFCHLLYRKSDLTTNQTYHTFSLNVSASKIVESHLWFPWTSVILVVADQTKTYSIYFYFID